MCSKSGCKQFSYSASNLIGGYHTSLCEEHSDEWDTFIKQTEGYTDLNKIQQEISIFHLRLMSEHNDADEQALRQLYEKYEACSQKLYELGRDWVRKPVE